jgi:alpha-L-rhamnosidase
MDRKHPAPTRLRTNDRDQPLGVGDSAPEFSWRVDGFDQISYEIEVTTESAETVWTSGVVAEGSPFGARYAGPALASATRYIWRVRAGDESTMSEWSSPTWFETGLLHPQDWSASWVTDAGPVEDRRTLYFHAVEEVPGQIVKARAYASALGWYRLFVNGEDVTGHSLVPRWTSFDTEVEYQAYDVTEYLRSGENTIGVVVAEGRFRGKNSYESRSAIYGDHLAAIVQIEAELSDGRHVRIVSRPGWLVGGGRIRTADHKHGERVDLRIPQTAGFSEPLDAKPAQALPPHPRALVAEALERVGEISRVRGVVGTTPAGVTLVDFGQNLTGVAHVTLSAPAGTLVRLSYSEVLTPEGELDVHYLDLMKRSKEWFQKDEIVVGADAEDYTPSFSLFGFRYLAIEADDPHIVVTVVAAEAVVISTPLDARADMTTSHPQLNKLWANVGWSLRSNFLDTATDCPTRERSGWTGDVQVFAPTAAILTQSDQYLRRYLHNLAVDQFDDGSVPVVIPREWSQRSPGNEGHQYGFRSAAGWGDAAVMVPATLHRYFGDEAVLRRQYPSACAWVEHVAQTASQGSGFARRFQRRAGDLEAYVVDTGQHFGEWLRPGENMMVEMIRQSVRPPAEVATAYFAHSASLLAGIATTLGEESDALRYGEMAAKARGAYRRAFVRKGGSRIGADKQDDYVRALAFDLLTPSEIPAAVDRLVHLIGLAGNHLGTGFLSTPMLLEVLTRNGRSDVAWAILMQDTAPSWMYQIGRGATTVWETWEGYDKHGAAKMSHNHYAFGSVAGWMFENIVGIRPLEPGYRHFVVEPAEGGGLASASGHIETGYGPIRVTWERKESGVEMRVHVPWGTRAHVPAAEGDTTLDPGEHIVRLRPSTSSAGAAR